MIIGYNDKGERIHIQDYVDGDIFCPDGHLLIAKKGQVRMHHYSHKSVSDCRFNCNKGPWHTEFQDRARKEHQEIRLTIGEKLHIADTLVGNYVIEYQHSPISAEDIKDRENFYTSLGYILVWVFDTSSWEYSITKNTSSLILLKKRGPDFPLLASCTHPVIKILDFGKRELFVVTSEKGKRLMGYTINLLEFDKIYLSIPKTTNNVRPFHHPLV
jgi:competence CoiA-like predicted nuclease